MHQFIGDDSTIHESNFFDKPPSTYNVRTAQKVLRQKDSHHLKDIHAWGQF